MFAPTVIVLEKSPLKRGMSAYADRGIHPSVKPTAFQLNARHILWVPFQGDLTKESRANHVRPYRFPFSMQCRRRFRRTGPHPVFRCVSMRRMPFLTENQQDCSGFPHQFQQCVENSKREKIPSQQFICIAGKSAVWNLLWRIVE